MAEMMQTQNTLGEICWFQSSTLATRPHDFF
jgi:hypothetical protein